MRKWIKRDFSSSLSYCFCSLLRKLADFWRVLKISCPRHTCELHREPRHLRSHESGGIDEVLPDAIEKKEKAEDTFKTCVDKLRECGCSYSVTAFVRVEDSLLLFCDKDPNDALAEISEYLKSINNIDNLTKH